MAKSTRVSRPAFRRVMKLVVVRPIKIGHDSILNPGDPVPKNIRLHVRRAWYARRRVGPKGSDWSKQMILNWEQGVANRKPEIVSLAPQVDRLASVREGLEPEKVGSQYVFDQGGEFEIKFTSKKKAAEWLETEDATAFLTSMLTEDETSEDGAAEDETSEDGAAEDALDQALT